MSDEKLKEFYEIFPLVAQIDYLLGFVIGFLNYSHLKDKESDVVLKIGLTLFTSLVLNYKNSTIDNKSIGIDVTFWSKVNDIIYSNIFDNTDKTIEYAIDLSSEWQMNMI